MNRDLTRAAAALAALAALASPAVHAEGFTARLHARAFEAAERGPDSLRTFIQRTRMIHALNYADYRGAVPNADVVSPAADPGYDLLPFAEERDAPRLASAQQRAADELREQILRDLSHE